MLDKASGIDLLVVGDILLGALEAEPLFDKVRAILRQGDVVVGQVEWPHTRRGQASSTDFPAPAADPDHLKAFRNAGFNVATVASNHMFDQGQNGVEDTLATLKALGIQAVGAGMNIAEARKPAIVDRNGVKVGVLAYNCIGPRESWATAVKAGTAHIHVMTHYELEYASPGSRPAEFSFPHPDHVEEMEKDIRALRREADVVVVVFHKGMVRIPVKLAHYERTICRAAIDAGAHAVLGHHAHVLRGVEVYKGCPIYHGINHFVVSYADPGRAQVTASGVDLHDRHAFRKAFREPSPDDRDPDSNFRFAAEARNTMIATLRLSKRGVEKAGFVPCWINEQEQPQPFGRDEARGAQVVKYIEDITRAIGSDTTFRWDGQYRLVFFERTAPQQGR
ncbi:MAG TPA: CapA family protein [Ramlibacter sp.]|nr:CapA family protein [Ramlibacter sp.]